MWHASVSGRFIPPQWTVLKEIACLELRNVGDATFGEWEERGEIAFHLRRRLSEKEMREARILGVCDIRGTPEHQARVDRLRPFLPPQFACRAFQEYP